MKANEFYAMMRDAPRRQAPVELTSDCWLVQFEGLPACETCPDRGKPQCGGGAALAERKRP